MTKNKKFALFAAISLFAAVMLILFRGNAVRLDSADGEYARYNIAAKTVTYYNVEAEDSADEENEGGDFSFNPAADISK